MFFVIVAVVVLAVLGWAWRYDRRRGRQKVDLQANPAFQRDRDAAVEESVINRLRNPNGYGPS
ncbi:hypothetical protein [Nocardioides sp. CER19]|uniref:hypothetical protein n=1 Tax=Nocardioides sp. CER19 TaxID=3038538 RepID=UPI00244D0593|nr:hypothetical protein [Nocardioides sp. CER19]MDH2415070.1 hypothetical protein [Nocardioides sp. CER19]